MRAIAHVDMDAFFAAIEILRNPSLKGKAVIVGGNPERRGVVSTCSYEARKFGVRSAMSLFEAKKRCPHGIFVEGSYSLYGSYSDQVMEILSSFTPLLEVVGIDEAYLDITQLPDSPFAIGQQIRRKVKEVTQLNCSVGIGSNKLIAKIASSYAKPNGLYEVPGGYEEAFLAPLAIETIPGIGKRSQALLNRDGISVISQLQSLSLDILINRYGAFGYYMYQACRGKDDRPVSIEDGLPKSVGAETTFEKDIHHSEVIIEELTVLFEKAYRRMRRYPVRTRGLSLKLRFSDFKTITRAVTFDTHTIEETFLLGEARNLFERVWQPDTPLRLIGLSFEKLTDAYWQPTFWDWLAEIHHGATETTER